MSKEEREEEETGSVSHKELLVLAVATSIDALAVGITFACVPVEIMAASQLVNTVVAVCLIGLTTFTISCVGIKAGSVFGALLQVQGGVCGRRDSDPDRRQDPAGASGGSVKK